MRLHSRIVLHSLALLLVVAVATGAIFALGARGAFQREVADRVARHVASLVGERLGDPPGLAARVRQLHEDFDVSVAVRDLDGRLLAAAGGPVPSPPPGALEDVRAGRLISRARPSWYAAAAVRDPASRRVVGTLEVAAPRRFAWAGLLRTGLAAGAVVLLVAVLTRPLARRLSRPLERLTEAARRLGGGDLSVRAPAAEGRRRWWHRRHPDEIQALTRAFNDMAGRVQGLVNGQRELLANVSHELRSPLARIRVALALVPRAGEADARLADVERDLDELDGLVDDVLTTARLDSTGLPTHLGPVRPRPLLEAVAERARHDPLTTGLVVEVVPGEDEEIVADEALLRRALWNLVENAAKYGAPPVQLRADRRDDAVALSVTDDGPGIPPAQRARVLEPFYRGDTARTPGPRGERSGVGLGLTLARRVAEVHGGRIEIGPARAAADHETGCRVTLTLPVRPA